MTGSIYINQTAGAAKNVLRSAGAELGRETSLVRHANALVRQTAAPKADVKKRPRKSGVYLRSQSEEVSVSVLSDGYVRRSPVQSVRVDPSFYKRRRKRFVVSAGACALIAAVAAVLLRYLGVA